MIDSTVRIGWRELVMSNNDGDWIDWDGLALVGKAILARKRDISAAAARNARRRRRRHFRAYGVEHRWRSRMNPNRTTWGRTR